jgi:hypothetical protein
MNTTRRSARQWRTALLALFALGTGCQAQLLLAGARPNAGWILYLAAALLFALALGNQVRDCATASAPTHAAPAPASALRSIPRLRLLCGVASILLALVALVFFLLPGGAGWGWLLHLLSVCFLLAAIIPSRARLTALKLSANKVAIVAVALLLVAAFVPRFWQASVIPQGVWFDEARLGVAARNLVSDSAYRPVYIPFIERPAHHEIGRAHV